MHKHNDSEAIVYSKVQKVSESQCWKLGVPILAIFSGDRKESFFADASDLIPSSEKRWSLPP